MGASHKGQVSWWKGKKLSEEHKINVSKALVGIKHTEEARLKQSSAQKGRKLSEETKRKISEAHKGKPMSIQARNNMSLATKGKPRPHMAGANNWNWKGGITPLRKKLYFSKEYKLWRTAVFQRDNYICVWCGQVGGYLEADHIKPWCDYPELRFAIDNGRTLCQPCHRTTETYGRPSKR